MNGSYHESLNQIDWIINKLIKFQSSGSVMSEFENKMALGSAFYIHDGRVDQT